MTFVQLDVTFSCAHARYSYASFNIFFIIDKRKNIMKEIQRRKIKNLLKMLLIA